MGTNYYIGTKNKELVEKYFPEEYSGIENFGIGYEVHLNKCSGGWKTLFETHKKAYNSVRELYNFLKTHEKEIDIYDEYGKILSTEEYKHRVLERDERLMRDRKPLCFKPDKIFGGMSLALCEDGEIPVIYTPIDHEEYQRLDSNSGCVHYEHDEEGFNFTEGWFC